MDENSRIVSGYHQYSHCARPAVESVGISCPSTASWSGHASFIFQTRERCACARWRGGRRGSRRRGARAYRARPALTTPSHGASTWKPLCSAGGAAYRGGMIGAAVGGGVGAAGEVDLVVQQLRGAAEAHRPGQPGARRRAVRQARLVHGGDEGVDRPPPRRAAIHRRSFEADLQLRDDGAGLAARRRDVRAALGVGGAGAARGALEPRAAGEQRDVERFRPRCDRQDRGEEGRGARLAPRNERRRSQPPAPAALPRGAGRRPAAVDRRAHRGGQRRAQRRGDPGLAAAVARPRRRLQDRPAGRAQPPGDARPPRRLLGLRPPRQHEAAAAQAHQRVRGRATRRNSAEFSAQFSPTLLLCAPQVDQLPPRPPRRPLPAHVADDRRHLEPLEVCRARLRLGPGARRRRAADRPHQPRARGAEGHGGGRRPPHVAGRAHAPPRRQPLRGRASRAGERRRRAGSRSTRGAAPRRRVR